MNGRGYFAFPTNAASFAGPKPTFASDSQRTSSPANFRRTVTTNGVSKKQSLPVNVSSAVQAPTAATGCSGIRPQAARPFFQMPDPQAIRRSLPSTRATMVVEPSFSPVSRAIDSSFRSFVGNVNVLPDTLAADADPS